MTKIFSVKRLILPFLLLVSLILPIHEVLAEASAGESQLVCALKRIINLVQGPIGQGVGIMAVIFLAVGLFMGKITWGVAIATALGIAVIFGASQIVEWLGGGLSGSNLDTYTCTD